MVDPEKKTEQQLLAERALRVYQMGKAIGDIFTKYNATLEDVYLVFGFVLAQIHTKLFKPLCVVAPKEERSKENGQPME